MEPLDGKVAYCPTSEVRRWMKRVEYADKGSERLTGVMIRAPVAAVTALPLPT
jgi:hypothetical protein